MIPCSWLTAGHVMGDPFEISTIRREVSISYREPSLPSMEHSIFSPTWLIKLNPLWYVCTEKRKSRWSVVVSLAYPRTAPRDFHLPLLQFWNNCKAHPVFFFGSASLLTSRSESSAWCDQLSPLSYGRLSVCLKKASGARGHQSATSLNSNVRC